MDALILSRLQFAVATYFHFLFVPLTLGLSILIAIMETIFVRTGDEEYRRMAKFWGKIFLINFAMGVVTGITLEFSLAPTGPVIRVTWEISSDPFWPSRPRWLFFLNPRLSPCGL